MSDRLKAIPLVCYRQHGHDATERTSPTCKTAAFGGVALTSSNLFSSLSARQRRGTRLLDLYLAFCLAHKSASSTHSLSYLSCNIACVHSLFLLILCCMYLSTVFAPPVPEVISSCLFFVERLYVTRTEGIIIIINTSSSSRSSSSSSSS